MNPDIRAVATITRVRIDHVPARPGPAWHWIYTVTPPSGLALITGTDRLAHAERVARLAGFRPCRAWEHDDEHQTPEQIGSTLLLAFFVAAAATRAFGVWGVPLWGCV